MIFSTISLPCFVITRRCHGNQLLIAWPLMCLNEGDRSLISSCSSRVYNRKGKQLGYNVKQVLHMVFKKRQNNHPRQIRHPFPLQKHANKTAAAAINIKSKKGTTIDHHHHHHHHQQQQPNKTNEQTIQSMLNDTRTAYEMVFIIVPIGCVESIYFP